MDIQPNTAIGGIINNDPNLITQALEDAGAYTPVDPSPGADPNIGCKTMEPTEGEVCDGTGAQAFAMVMIGGLYTKPD